MLVKTLKAKHLQPGKIAAIDASSRNIAIAVFERGEVSKLVKTNKFEFTKNIKMIDKLKAINHIIPLALENENIYKIVIEQPIYIQSPQTSRILSQISGAVWANCLRYCDDVSEVTIQSWKAHIGYKNITKKDIAAWAEQIGTVEAKKKAISERKQRTINLVHEKIDGIEHITDNDICDALGIGLWGLENL